MAERYRDSLIRECFELERDFHFWEFRQHHWEQAEIVSTLPDAEEREVVLREFWNHDAEKRFPEYQQAIAALSLQELEAEKEQWLDRMSLLSEREYKDILAEDSSRMPTNDNANHALFKEWKADYAASKREDAHWYGPQPADSFDKVLSKYTDHKTPDKDRGPER